jgi:hypothetical protein
MFREFWRQIVELEALKEAAAARGLGTPATRTNIIEILIEALRGKGWSLRSRAP